MPGRVGTLIKINVSHAHLPVYFEQELNLAVFHGEFILFHLLPVEGAEGACSHS